MLIFITYIAQISMIHSIKCAGTTSVNQNGDLEVRVATLRMLDEQE